MIAGPRTVGEGTDDQEQGIIDVKPTENGCDTLLPSDYHMQCFAYQLFAVLVWVHLVKGTIVEATPASLSVTVCYVFQKISRFAMPASCHCKQSLFK